MSARILPAQIRAIHAIKSKVHLDEGSYRAMLAAFDVPSSTYLTAADADRLLARLRQIPGASNPVQRGAQKAAKASGRYAPKLQAMWLALYNLAAVRDNRDAAMHAFLQRQTGLDHTRFLVEALAAAQAIEALKAWLIRVGVIWPAVTGDHYVDRMAMKRAILRRQWSRGIEIGAIGAFGPPEAYDGLQDYASSILHGAPRRLGSIEDPSLAPGDLDTVSAALGKKLRKAQADTVEARDVG